ncbi:ATP-binding protein [[Clostridium] saccharogumia]|uniref:ATP-binding protein n=1 Tax=Thomasclavelia saccharogumia TaxID=341225 RepID=UPI001D0673ED|nr:ATP-binding protein [Thomasclavelia saccharogumia]
MDKTLTTKLSTCDYIQDHLNVTIIGATDTGKTFYISALSNEACKKEINVIYMIA